jgi:hypothetical protein
LHTHCAGAHGTHRSEVVSRVAKVSNLNEGEQSEEPESQSVEGEFAVVNRRYRLAAKSIPKKLERHSDRCTICRSPQRAEIEEQFCNWIPHTKIASDYKLGRMIIHRHALACGLFEKRDRNLRASLAHFIERGFRARVTGPSFVAAVIAYSKIDDRGRTVERLKNESDNGLHAAFSKMTRREMRTYAVTGALPDWFPKSRTPVHVFGEGSS